MAYATEGPPADGPTLCGVAASIDQHQKQMHEILRRARSIADHLSGAVPPSPGGVAGECSPGGVVFDMFEGVGACAAIGAVVSLELSRIEHALGTDRADEAKRPEPEYDSMRLGTGVAVGRIPR